ncbi:MAG: anti-sigma factor family protein [Thermodesulfobacteriota bacterium]
MKCSKVQKKLSAYQDNQLKPLEQEEVRNHLLSCRACREQFAELERVWQTLGELKEIQPNPWFYRQIVRKIKEPREQGLLPTLQHVFRLSRAPVAVSIILIIGLLAGTYLGSILARCDLFPFQSNPVSDSRGVLTSMRFFDPAPPGTLAEGYYRMASYKESESR